MRYFFTLASGNAKTGNIPQARKLRDAAVFGLSARCRGSQ